MRFFQAFTPSRIVNLTLPLALFAAFTLASPANAKDKLKVVTTFTIIQDIAQNIAGEAAIVESITKPGAEIHDYQPTPRDIVKAQSADLILWNGLNLERWFSRFFENIKDVPAVTVTEGITPLPIREGAYNGNPNPHAWMSPSNALIYVENIRKGLVQYDPDNAEIYNRNAKAYAEKITALDAPCVNVWHGFQKRSVGSSPAKGPLVTSPPIINSTKFICGLSMLMSRVLPSRYVS